MKKFTYDPPELAEAKFGQFVQGAFASPGGNGDNDSGTGDL